LTLPLQIFLYHNLHSLDLFQVQGPTKSFILEDLIVAITYQAPVPVLVGIPLKT